MDKTIYNRKTYLDVLKILACVAVIMMHSTVISTNSFMDWCIARVFNIIGNFAVPIFVMVSGALLLNPGKKITVKNIFLKYIPKLIISLVLVNFIMNLVSGLLDRNLSFSTLLYSICNVFLFRVSVPYWYIYMLIGLYLVTPILKEWINKAPLKNIEYFLILFIGYRIIAYTILNIPEIDFFAKFKDVYSSIQLPIVTGYCGYFILGYYLSIKDFSKIKKPFLLILLFTVLILTIALELFFAKSALDYTTSKTIFMDVFSINIFCISVCLFLFVKSNITKYNSIVTHFSCNTYGIYLFHVLGLQLLSKFNVEYIPPIIYIPLCTIVVFLFSYLATSIIQKIPYINKYFK